MQGPRAQADRRLYAAAVRRLLEDLPGLALREIEVDDLVVRGAVWPASSIIPAPPSPPVP